MGHASLQSLRPCGSSCDILLHLPLRHPPSGLALASLSPHPLSPLLSSHSGSSRPDSSQALHSRQRVSRLARDNKWLPVQRPAAGRTSHRSALSKHRAEQPHRTYRQPHHRQPPGQHHHGHRPHHRSRHHLCSTQPHRRSERGQHSWQQCDQSRHQQYRP